jgi:hypothetical protein
VTIRLPACLPACHYSGLIGEPRAFDCCVYVCGAPRECCVRVRVRVPVVATALIGTGTGYWHFPSLALLICGFTLGAEERHGRSEEKDFRLCPHRLTCLSVSYCSPPTGILQ